MLVTTPNRLYQFIGYVSNSDEKPLLQQIFNNYLTVPEGFQEIPSSLKYSRLQFYYPSPRSLPKMCAWLTEPGIFYGQVSNKFIKHILSSIHICDNIKGNWNIF